MLILLAFIVQASAKLTDRLSDAMADDFAKALVKETDAMADALADAMADRLSNQLFDRLLAEAPGARQGRPSPSGPALEDTALGKPAGGTVPAVSQGTSRSLRPLAVPGVRLAAPRGPARLPLQDPAAAGASPWLRAPLCGGATATETEEAATAAAPSAVALDPRKSGLALKLDDGTRKSHSLAENSAFVTGFFRGLTDKTQFSQLVADLYFVYQAMETAFKEAADENVRTLDYPELRRVPSLEKDMEYYYGDNWRATVKPSRATARYVARIEEVAREQPPLLIAHQYTRYLGDLFGGQMMGGMAQKSLKLAEGKGIAFYTFEEIPEAKEFINDWYSQVNRLKLSETEKNAIVDEANVVFRYNIELFDELDGNPIVPMFCLAIDALKERLGLTK
jgi:heme oxygenase